MADTHNHEYPLDKYIRNIADFPKPGIQFKDITPLLKAPVQLNSAVQQLVAPFVDKELTAVAAIEARGFIIGSLAAAALKVGFIPLRKVGKLPAAVNRLSYSLEYGTAQLEIHQDALGDQDRVLLVDDLLATGGSAAASCQLITQLGAAVTACAFIIELDFLAGREKLAAYPLHSLIHY